MIKVVALDIYGTVLAFDDHDYSMPPRRGLEEFLDKCDSCGIKVVTSSDSHTANVRNDLVIAFKLLKELQAGPPVLAKGLCLERFDGFFKMDVGPKDFSVIIGHYDILPQELLVVGDRMDRDIYPALRLGAYAVHCPAYGVREGRDWDFSQLDPLSI